MFVLSSDAKLSEPKLYGHFYVIWSKQLSLPLLPFGFNPVTLLEAKRRKAYPGDMVYNNGKVVIQPPQPALRGSPVSRAATCPHFWITECVCGNETSVWDAWGAEPAWLRGCHVGR